MVVEPLTGETNGRATNTAAPEDLFQVAASMIESRRNVSPKRLSEPGPSEGQLFAILGLAGAAPDHGRLMPWRFMLVPEAKRSLLADAFAAALVARDAAATTSQIEAAREKAYRAPVLIIAIARLHPDGSDIPTKERMISMGAAIQNMLLGAHAMGFGSGLTSGKAMTSIQLRSLLALDEGEETVCSINIGRVNSAPRPSVRALPAQFFTTL